MAGEVFGLTVIESSPEPSRSNISFGFFWPLSFSFELVFHISPIDQTETTPNKVESRCALTEQHERPLVEPLLDSTRMGGNLEHGVHH